MENVSFQKAILEDKDFILNANNEINKLSGLNDSELIKNIDKDIFEGNNICKCLIIKNDNQTIGSILYSYIYWANLGTGIYLSQIYIIPEFRNKGLLRSSLNYIKNTEENCKFITAYVGEENKLMMKSFEHLGAKKTDLSIYYLGINNI